VFAEMNQTSEYPSREHQVERFGLTQKTVSVAVSEKPGRWCFPPLAATIAGAARLMLALLERSVSDLGGTYAFCDTDSMAIVATRDGGLVECPGGPERCEGERAAIKAL